MYILSGILLLIAATIVIVLIRTLRLQPTSAKTANIELDNSQRAREYGRRLSRMIQKETISSRANEDLGKFYRFHEELESLFPKVHKNCEKHEFKGSLLFRWKGKGTHAPILLMSHHDVVEATGEWKHEPFSGDIDEKGCVWGRGTVDTKGSLFCIFSAVEELIWEGFQPECDVYIASSCTEEISGEGAPLIAKYLKDQGVSLALLLDEGGMIVEEPVGGVKGLYGMVGVVEKGYGDVKFIARSGGGHASAPGKNTPLVRLGKFMADVEKKNPFRAQLTPTVREMFRRMTPNMAFGMRMIFANLWLFRPVLDLICRASGGELNALVRTTTAFTMAEGSNARNVIPAQASFVSNMRLNPTDSVASALETLKKAVNDEDVEITLLEGFEPSPISETNCPAWDKVAAAVILQQYLDKNR